MIELNSENLKQAIAQQLMVIAPEATVYKEAYDTPIYPNFYVYQISVMDSQILNNQHELTFLMSVTYRNIADPSTDLKLEQRLDSMSLRLLSGFNVIPFGDEYIKVRNKEMTKTDGVLVFTFELVTIVKYVSNETVAKQNSVSVNIKL